MHPCEHCFYCRTQYEVLTLNESIATKVVCFFRLLKCLRSLYGKQCGPRSGAVCSGSTSFASLLNLSVILAIICSRRLQQTTFSDAFFLGALRVKVYTTVTISHILSCAKHGFSRRHFLLASVALARLDISYESSGSRRFT